MKLKYKKFGDVYLTTYSKYAPTDRDGNVLKEAWTEQFTSNLKFNKGFDLESIKKIIFN